MAKPRKKPNQAYTGVIAEMLAAQQIEMAEPEQQLIEKLENFLLTKELIEQLEELVKVSKQMEEKREKLEKIKARGELVMDGVVAMRKQLRDAEAAQQGRNIGKKKEELARFRAKVLEYEGELEELRRELKTFES
ncbi:hypothetical protein BCR34DRAFT_635269 [Clohesyomyces aquaticus]|uniref:Uncharacterized protein n=1 Tax=Clohesyomyces aquaticus TaxID=1231657 RepID=A0A1Y2A2Y3_9PLEO|nr:hypothetical protein BCR34DRAFT_635269 [Clohesyomyces aquaticus]